MLSIDFIKSSASFFPELLVVMRYQIHSGSEEADDFMKSTIPALESLELSTPASFGSI